MDEVVVVEVDVIGSLTADSRCSASVNVVGTMRSTKRGRDRGCILCEGVVVRVMLCFYDCDCGGWPEGRRWWSR